MQTWIAEEKTIGRLLFSMHADGKSERYNKIRHKAAILMLNTAKIENKELYKSSEKFILAKTKGQHDVNFILKLLYNANVTVIAQLV